MLKTHKSVHVLLWIKTLSLAWPAHTGVALLQLGSIEQKYTFFKPDKPQSLQSAQELDSASAPAHHKTARHTYAQALAVDKPGVDLGLNIAQSTLIVVVVNVVHVARLAVRRWAASLQ